MSDVTDNRAASRYELVVDGVTATAAYQREGDVVTFTHTVVPVEIGGRGVGSILIGEALADVRARGLKVVAQCSFVAAYIEKHPAERELLA